MVTAHPPVVADQRVDAGELSVSFVDAGSPTAEPIVLLHGFPYDIHSYDDVVPLLVEAGFRVLVPYLRGHGGTDFLDEETPRAGERAALATDLVAFIDAVGLDRPVIGGFGWGGEAACIVAALWPERLRGLVTTGGSLIDDTTSPQTPDLPDREAAAWYRWYFLTERGRAGLAHDPGGIAAAIWRTHSPGREVAPRRMVQAVTTFGNPCFVDVIIHGHRHRFGSADGYPQHAAVERRLQRPPAITVPTVTLHDRRGARLQGTTSPHLAGPHWRRDLPGVGHDVPGEAPQAFAEAVLDVADPPSFGDGTP